MERVTGIGGVFLRSLDPAALAAWYAEQLGLDVEEWHGSVLRSAGGETLVWAAFPADTEYFGRLDQQAMVNYRVGDLDAMLAQLRAAGVDCRRADGARERTLRLGHRPRREPLRALAASAGATRRAPART